MYSPVSSVGQGGWPFCQMSSRMLNSVPRNVGAALVKDKQLGKGDDPILGRGEPRDPPLVRGLPISVRYLVEIRHTP